MSQLVMLRHGLSQWNIENRFTGWVDVPLAEEGKAQARDTAKLHQRYNFEVAYTSLLLRAADTLDIVLDEMKHPKLEIIRDASLNERNYGDLQGKNKNEIRKTHGEELFQLWRRSYFGKPPGGESLQETAERTLPFLSSSFRLRYCSLKCDTI